MRATWYERQGSAAEVLEVGELPDPQPGPGEVRLRVAASGVNAGDVKKRRGWLGSAMPWPRIIPHSDGAGTIDAVGPGVDRSRIGERAWVFGAQSYRPFGTAAELVVVPEWMARTLPDHVEMGVGASLGIAGITAHRAVFADGDVRGKVVLVSGAAGAVGSIAVQLAVAAGAVVLATVRSEEDVHGVARRGAHHAFVLGPDTAEAVRAAAPRGVDRIVEVALGENAGLDAAVIAQGAVIAAYASGDPDPRLPFWPLLFQNAVIRLLGSDDFPRAAKEQAAESLVAALEDGQLDIGPVRRFSLDDVAAAHDAVERGSAGGRVVVAPA